MQRCKKLSIFSILSICMLQFFTACAQDSEIVLTSEVQRAVISELRKNVSKNYIIRDMAAEIDKKLQQKLDAQAYDDIDSFEAFSEALTSDLRAWSGDLHFLVFYTGVPPKPGDIIARQPKTPMTTMLEGKIAHFQNITKLSNRQRDAFVDAMKTVENADGLIIDLRECSGGDRKAVNLLTSYFFEKPIYLHTFEEIGKKPQEVWTSKKIPGKRLPDIPIYVLTSKATASGGESLAYLLKHHNRAKIVGEVTKGAAHGVRTYDLAYKYRAFIPYFRTIHPATNANWEAKGVIPDILVPAEAALDEAHQHLLKAKE